GTCAATRGGGRAGCADSRQDPTAVGGSCIEPDGGESRMRRRSRAPGVPRVVLLTDRTQLPAEHCLVETVIECHRAGLEAVVVREHDLEPYARRALLAQLARLPGLWVISSRIPDPSAHGLHLAAHQPAP